ncbi:MAG: multidrug effflux MFS transporter [Caulobacteraceae bacterium]|nr:multidrug effflux MFS transporter [Caulobacteraceae bacterium]
MSSAAGPQAFKPAKAPVGLVVLLGVLTAYAPLSIDMYLPSLPAIGRAFHASPDAAQATLASFLAGLALGQLVYGPASDRWGRRGPILIGAALYAAASIACALAPSLPALIVARFVQALGGCAGTVVARAVVRDRFGHRDSARVLSLLMLVMGLAPILAPLAGGALLGFGGWRTIFWVLTVLGSLIAVAAFFALPESRSAETAAQARGEHPARAYLELLRQPQLVGFVLAGALNSAALFAYVSGSPGLLIGLYGVKPADFGWIFGANAFGMVAMSQLNGRLLHTRTPEQIVALVRPVSLVFAVLMAGAAATGFAGMWGVLVPLFFLMGTFGLIGPNTIAGGLNIDPRRAGSVSALMGAAQFAVGAVASGVTGAIHARSALPMSAVILACIVASTVALYTMALPPKARTPRGPSAPAR